MWGLRATLQGLDQTGHLPVGFDPARGIRSLFPSPQKGRINISLLRSYLFSVDGSAATGEISGAYHLRADGAGNWLFSGGISTTIANGGSGRWGAGFVFMFSQDNAGHGFVQTGDYDLIGPPDAAVLQAVVFLIKGGDSWLTANWPQAFAKPAGLYISNAMGLNKLPDINNAATDRGFTGGLAAFKGAVVSMGVQETSLGGGGNPQPPSGFPGPIDWGLPPADGE